MWNCVKKKTKKKIVNIKLLRVDYIMTELRHGFCIIII